MVTFFAKARLFHSVVQVSHFEARFFQSSMHSFADSPYFLIKSMRAFSRSSGVSFPLSTDFTASLMSKPTVDPSSSIFFNEFLLCIKHIYIFLIKCKEKKYRFVNAIFFYKVLPLTYNNNEKFKTANLYVFINIKNICKIQVITYCFILQVCLTFPYFSSNFIISSCFILVSSFKNVSACRTTIFKFL